MNDTPETLNPDRPLTFMEVMTAHEMAKSREPEVFSNMDLRGFSQYMNKLTGSQQYRAGDTNPVNRAFQQYSAGLNESLAPISEQAGSVGADLGSLIGQPEIGREAGHALPRMVADFIPMALGGALEATGVGAPAGVALQGATLGNVYSGALENSGSPLAAGISAATIPAMGVAGKFGQGVVSRAIAPVTEDIASPLLSSLIEKPLEYAGRLAGVGTAMETGGELSSLAAGQGLYNPLDKKHLALTAATMLPFELASIPSMLKNPSMTAVLQAETFFKTLPTVESQIQQRAAEVTANRDPSPTTQPSKRFEAEQFDLPFNKSEPAGPKLMETGDLGADFYGKLAEGPKGSFYNLREDLKDPVTGEVLHPAGSTVSENTLMKYGVKYEKSKPPQMFVPQDLMDGFGSIAAEQLNGTTEKPLGISLTPTEGKKMVPGNAMLQAMEAKLPKEELEILKENGLTEFLKGQRKPLEEVYKWVKENGPQVEVRTIKSGDKNAPGSERDLGRQLAEIHHQLDTVYPNWRDVAGTPATDAPPNVRELILREQEIASQEAKPSHFDPDIYKSITTKHGGQTVILVRKPLKSVLNDWGDNGEKKMVKNGGLKFEGSHFDEEDKNILGFVRGEWETTKEGEKVFHVIEVQSDWGQRVRTLKDKTQYDAGVGDRVSAANKLDDPLLRDHQRLALKAAITHAIKEGADKIALSDAETAMLTEGHDRHALDNNAHLWRDPNKLIKQEPGMRLNYDEILPRILKELTGYEGKKEEYGTHANTSEGGQTMENGQAVTEPRSNLIFRNSDNTPKTSVTAHTYPLDKARAELLRRGGYTIFGRDKIVEQLRKMEVEGVTGEELERAAHGFSGAITKSGDLEKDLYNKLRSQGGSEQSTAATVHEFFKQRSLLRGAKPEEADFWGRMGVAAYSRFSKLIGGVGLAESTTQGSFAVPPQKGENGIVALFNRTSKGETEGWFRGMWDFSHELAHQVEFAVLRNDPGVPEHLKAAYRQAVASAREMTPGDMFAATNGLIHQMLKGKGDFTIADRLRAYQNPETGISEFVTDYLSLLSMSAIEPKSVTGVKDLAFFGNKETASLLGSWYKTMTNIWSGVKKYLNLSGTKTDATPLQTIHENLSKIVEAAGDQETAKTLLAGIVDRGTADIFTVPRMSYEQAITLWRNVPQAAWNVSPRQMAVHDPGLVKDAEASRSPFGKTISWWEKAIKPIVQLIKEYPETRDGFGLGLGFHAQVSNNTLLLFDALANKAGRQLMKAVGKDGTAPNSAFNEVAQRMQEQEKVLTKEEKMKIPSYQKLTDKQRGDVDALLSHFNSSATRAGVLLVQSQRREYEMGAARVFQSHDTKLGYREAVEYGRILTKKVFNGKDKLTPEEDLKLSQYAANHEIGYDAAISVANDGVQPFAEFQKKMLGPELQGKPWYLPEVRLGKFHIGWRDDEEQHLFDFKNKKEAEEFYAEKKKLQDAGTIKNLVAYNKEDKAGRFEGLAKGEQLDMFREADQKIFNSIVARLSATDPNKAETLAELQELYQPGDGATREVESPYMQERRLIGGRERLNYVEGMVHYLNSTSRGVAKRYVRQHQAVALNDPVLRSNPNLQNNVRTYLKAITSPTGSEFTKLKNFIFMNYMGFNPSSVLIEPTQQVMALVPYLVREGAGIGETYKYLAKAWGAVGEKYRTKNYSNPEIQRAMEGWEKDRIVDTGILQELFSEQDTDFAINRSELTGNGKIADASDLARNVGYHTLGLARNFYGLATRFNSRVAAVSSFLFAREKLGMNFEQADQFARNATRTSMFGGGTANRPLAFYGLGKATGVGGLLYSLQGYTFNMLSMTGRLVKESINSNGQLSPSEKLAARKAAGLALGAQLVFGGVMGLPLTAGAVAVIEQLFPESQVKKKLRQAFFGLAQGDENLGHIIADGAMNGVANTGPIDFGSRFQLGSLLGVSPYDGFSWKNALGPLPGVLENYVKAGQEATQGKYAQAGVGMLPTGLKNVAKLYLDDGAYRDQGKDLIYQPSIAEQVFGALGFKPKALQQYYEQQGIMKRAEQVEARDTQEFHEELAQRLMQGDTQGVKDALMERQMSSRGTYDVREGLKRVVEIAQAYTTPQDPLRNSTRAAAQTAQDLALTYGRTPAPSETQQLMQRMALERQVGIPGAGRISTQEIVSATMVDRLMQANPSLTRTQALLMVERALHPVQNQLRFGAGQ